MKFNHEVYMVCNECLLAAAGYSQDEVGDDVDLSKTLTKFANPLPKGYALIPLDDLESAHDDFSTLPCEGCDTQLAGSRDPVVLLIPMPMKTRKE